MLNKKFNYLNFQNKKMYNFSSKESFSNLGNIYSYLLTNKLTQLQLLNSTNTNSSNFFLAKMVNIKKDVEFNRDRLNITLKRGNISTLNTMNYSRIGYNKFAIYSIFSSLKIGRFFLNEKKYQRILAYRGYNIFESGMKSYVEKSDRVKNYNNYFESKIFNIYEKKNKRIHKNAEISAYFTQITAPLFEEKTTNYGRVFLNIWDELGDDTIENYLFDFVDRKNLDIKNSEELTKTLRDYEMYYGLKFYKKEMQESLWKLGIGKRTYLDIFSKNAIRVNFLKDASVRRYGLNTRMGAKKEFGLLRSLYTKYLFPRNMYELDKGFENFNIFPTTTKTLGINQFHKLNITNKKSETDTNIERVFLKKNKDILVKVVNTVKIKELNFKIKFKKSNILLKKKQKKILITFFKKIKIFNRKVKIIKKKKIKLIKLFFNKIKILTNSQKSQTILNMRSFLNKKQLKVLLINAMFRILPYNKIRKRKVETILKQKVRDTEISYGAVCGEGWANGTFTHKDPRLIMPEYVIGRLSWEDAFSEKVIGFDSGNSFKILEQTNLKKITLERKSYLKINHIGSKRKLKNTIQNKFNTENLGILKINNSKDLKKILEFKLRLLVKSNRFLNYKKFLNKKLETIQTLKTIPAILDNAVVTDSGNLKYSFKDYAKKANTKINLQKLRIFAKKAINTKLSSIPTSKQVPFWILSKINSTKDTLVEDSSTNNLNLATDTVINSGNWEKEIAVLKYQDLKYNIGAVETLKQMFNLNTKREDDIKFELTKINSSNLLFRKYNYRIKLENKDIITNIKIFTLKFLKKNLSKLYLKNKMNREIKTFFKFSLKTKIKGFNVLKIQKYTNTEKKKLKVLYQEKIFQKINITQKQKFRLKFFREVLNTKTAQFANYKKIIKKERKRLLNKYLGISSYVNKFTLYLKLKNKLFKFFENKENLKEILGDEGTLKNLDILHLGSKINNIHKKCIKNGIFNTEGIAMGAFWKLFVENSITSPIKQITYGRLLANTLMRLFKVTGFGKNRKTIGYAGRFNFLHRYDLERYESQYEFGLQQSIWLKDRISELKFLTKETNKAELKMAVISETKRLKYPSAKFLRHLELADRYFDQRYNLSLSYDSHSKIPSLLFWEDIKTTIGDLLKPTQLYTRIRVSGKAAVFKNSQIPWKYKTPRHLFLKDRHKQFGNRKFPIYWYRIMRKKFPLKSQKKDWAIKIPLAERLAPFNKLIKSTNYDSSTVYYKHLGWATMTKKMRRIRNMNYFYRYGRDGEFTGEVPLSSWLPRNTMPSVDAVHEGFLRDREEDSISVFRNNITEFVTPNDSEKAEGLRKFFYTYGKESLISFSYYFQSYKDSLKKWHSKMKPTLGYFGIKTYYLYNSYIMQVNNEIKSRRYKTIFNNYSFSVKVNKTEFSKNLTFINFTKLARETYTQFNTKLYDKDVNKLYNFSNAFKYLVRNFRSKYRFYNYSGYDTLTFNRTEMLPASLTITNRDYFTNSQLPSVNHTLVEAKNKARTVKTFNNFQYRNKTTNSILIIQGLLNNASVQYGLKNFTATNLLW